ncbi:Myc-type, basic helix-loop-helix domain-containing protein [Absidia repens]|uniref:Myc-type, basic helix-loop-helix domain-containing protein n=1 Tax=Absidia repens TaxID=90262 RepID=A0A1X2IKF7_9FUNG|nr:Myc-type, basic helix-loop-helix domain-containing protein [Absidia repens]
MTKAEIRKENHNKVERKRREAINQAMDDLSALLPGNEKSKSRVLGRAVEYIKLLMKENTGLRQQVEQHCEANHQYQIEIASLKAQLNIQAQ